MVATLLGLFALAGRREAFRFPRRQWAILAGLVFASALLLGGIGYGMNLYRTGHIVGPPPETVSQSSYGQWSNIWMFTTMLLLRPFSSSSYEGWNPWYGQDWWWLKYDLYFSHFGVVFSLIVLTLPFAVIRYARRGGADGRSSERWMASLAFLMTFFAIVPYKCRPLGLFAAFGRYVLFVVPVVVAWTVVPLARELLEAGAWRGRLGRVLLAACSASFVANAIDIALHDAVSPIAFVAAALAHPGIQLSDVGNKRAAIVVDRIAGPDDHIAISGDFDTYLYPAFGRERRRRLSFIPDGPGPVKIPADARWVIVDRTLNKVWGNPDFKTMGQYKEYLGHGAPSADDLRVFRQLSADRGWKLVHLDAEDNQAIFLRMPGDVTSP